MENYQSSHTGREIDEAVDKTSGLANIKSVGDGLSLSPEGALAVTGGGGSSAYLHKVKFLAGPSSTEWYANVITNSATQLTSMVDVYNAIVQFGCIGSGSMFSYDHAIAITAGPQVAHESSYSEGIGFMSFSSGNYNFYFIAKTDPASITDTVVTL